jgi:hypothetical protein
VTVFGNTFNFAVYDMLFDQDLYVLAPIGCIGISNCSVVPDLTSCALTCDFTGSISNCGRQTSMATLLGCNCSLFASDLCDRTNNKWTDITPGTFIQGSTSVTDSPQYRFFINETCTSFRLDVFANNSLTTLV